MDFTSTFRHFSRNVPVLFRYQLPATIWDGMPIKKGYRESSRDLMRKFYEKNNYPTLEERRLIAEQSGLNIGRLPEVNNF